MDKINYSFIIPHKNSLALLERCVKSIPLRDDVQVIVVDDDSRILKEEWDGFKMLFPNIELIKAKGCKSAGAVRNLGLSYAKGQWVLFADCDDYYEHGFLDILDKYIGRRYDVVYFNATSNNTNAIEDIHKLMEKCKKNQGKWLDFVRFKIRNPWMKMVKLHFLQEHNIRFEDIVLGNDIWFSMQVGYYAKKIAVLDDEIYVYCYNQNSITNHRSIEKNVAEIEGYIKLNSFYSFINHPEWHISYLGYIKWNILHRPHPFKQVLAYIKNILIFYKKRNYYVNQLK